MSVNQLVCIKRPEPSLSAVFEEMYLSERLVDVTLSCCDGQLQAHRLVLAACSPYFSNLFEKLPNPFHYPVVIIKDLNIDDLRMIVDFMYKGQLTLSQDKLADLVKSAEGLEIHGLSSTTNLLSCDVDSRDLPNHSSTNGSRPIIQKVKRGKKATLNSSHFYGRADKLLEQSMITGDSMGGNSPNQTFSYSGNDTLSTRNLAGQHSQTSSGSSLQVQAALGIEQSQHHLNTQLQVLSHSLTANRSTISSHTIDSNAHLGGHPSQIQSRGQLHHCNICWKSFREKANLKRHLQVHSTERIVYACPDCNKTFSWKDNYIRHTKTAHHLNNARSQT